MKYTLFLCVVVVYLSSCTRRNIIYLDGLTGSSKTYSGDYALPAQPKIKAGDILSITVSSSSPKSDEQFNLPVTADKMAATEATSTALSGYPVNLDGQIDFPVIGSVRAMGLTKAELRDYLQERIGEYLQAPVVNVRAINTQITVLGEVTRPATFTVSTETVTLFQALGMAGDLTVYGNRNKVMVIREVNGARTVVNLDLQDATLLDSPFYFLQSNDVVYVEPIDTKSEQASLTRSNVSIALSALTILTFLFVGRG